MIHGVTTHIIKFVGIHQKRKLGFFLGEDMIIVINLTLMIFELAFELMKNTCLCQIDGFTQSFSYPENSSFQGGVDPWS